MGTRPSKVSPSMLGFRGQVLREDSTLPSNILFPPKLPIVSIVPKSPAPVVVSQNGFMTPRSRGRSALYSMARTPYSRVNPTTTIKVCWGKNKSFHSFTLLLVFQSSLFCISVRMLHRHLMFTADHHHLSLHWCKIEYPGLHKGYSFLWELLFVFWR